ncbi:MAG: dTDP-4-dehydrorhamnose 3,5-epimerase [Actinobacteria bacterium ATB1]|nr:dTDP-4-dehydrorhamnose 3,5-epimerase [Actinobacteria bacterium ATB1]
MSKFEFEFLAIPDVILVKPRVFGDSRGFFAETYRKNEFAEVGITEDFVQDNHSRSGAKILRGLHFQIVPQGKLVRAATGRIFDVAADVRPGSPTYKQWVGTELSDENMHQIYVPPGFAHGFVVLGDSADVCYKVGPAYFADETERGIKWNDSDIAVEWPVSDPSTSDRDRDAPSLADIEEDLREWFG